MSTKTPTKSIKSAISTSDLAAATAQIVKVKKNTQPAKKETKKMNTTAQETVTVPTDMIDTIVTDGTPTVTAKKTTTPKQHREKSTGPKMNRLVCTSCGKVCIYSKPNLKSLDKKLAKLGQTLEQYNTTYTCRSCSKKSETSK